MSNASVVIERTFNASVEKVWFALTENEQMKKWYFNLKEFKPEVGFQFEFYGGTEEKQWLHLCEITEVIPLKKLTHSWRYDGYGGNSFVTFELFDEGDKTRLILTHTGLETFPADIPEFKMENFVEGWKDIIGTSLEEFLKE